MPKIPKPVIVLSKGKPTLTYTAEWFNKHSFSSQRVTYVISEGDDVDAYKASTGCKVVVAPNCPNLASKHAWSLAHFTTPTQPWIIFIEDNIRKVTCVVKEKYHLDYLWPNTHADFRSRTVSPQEILSILEEDIALAESQGIYYGGFASNESNNFRKIKYRYASFVWGKLCYASNRGPLWPTKYNEKDDYAFTAANLLYCGKVLINCWLYAWPRIESKGRGGSRSLSQRVEDKRKAVQLLHAEYPNLFRDRNKKSGFVGTEVQIRYHNVEQVEKWRQSFKSFITE